MRRPLRATYQVVMGGAYDRYTFRRIVGYDIMNMEDRIAVKTLTSVHHAVTGLDLIESVETKVRKLTGVGTRMH